MQGNLFSDSWHRVAKLKVSLLNSVKIYKQKYRKKIYYVLEEPFNGSFFKVSKEAYNFLIRLKISKTIEEIWEDNLIKQPKNTPTQDEVIRLLGQLHNSSLLYFSNPPDNEAIFQRYTKTKTQEKIRTVTSILFLKIPLWDPENFLKNNQKLIHLIFSKLGFIIWLIVIFLGLKTAFVNRELLALSTEGILAPSNLFLLYLCLASLKLIHELSHAMLVKRFNGEVHTMGIMFLIFTPLPYLDASAAWAFRDKWQRILVSAAGMISELFIASIACFIWANTKESLIHSLSFNIMFIGSISSLLFNGNPLARLDSYYILADILEIPNLANRAIEEWRYMIDTYIFGIKQLTPIAESNLERFWLLSYGFFSFLYRVLLSFGIALFVMDQWFSVGLFFAFLSLFFFIGKPIFKYFYNVFFDDKYLKNRFRAVSLSLLLIILSGLTISFYPISNSIRAPALIEIKDSKRIINKSDGILTKIHFTNGSFVKKDSLLFEFENFDLITNLKISQAQLLESYSLKAKAKDQALGDLFSITERINFLLNKIENLEKRIQELKIYANIDGTLVSNDLNRLLGNTIKIGKELAYIIPKNQAEAIAIVSQEQAFDLFLEKDLKGEVRLYGSAKQRLYTKKIEVLPQKKDELPSAALGIMGGGTILVDQKDGITAKESFFEVLVSLDKQDLKQHRTGELKIYLPNSSIFNLSYKYFAQLMQKRYNF